MNDQIPDAERQSLPPTTDQPEFLRALGIDPEMVLANTISIEFNAQGVALVGFRAVVGVTPQQLGMAFMRAGGMFGAGAGGESSPVEPGDNMTEMKTQRGRRTAAKKTAAKTTQKKTT